MGAGWAGKQFSYRGWKPRVPGKDGQHLRRRGRSPIGDWSVDTSRTRDGGEAAWRSSQPVPRRAIPSHTRVLRAPRSPRSRSPSATSEAIPLPRVSGSAGPQRAVRLRAGSGGRGAPPFWIRTVREPPPARRGAGSSLAEPRARARAAREGGRAGGGGRERGWQRRKGVVGTRAAAASGLLSGGSAPLLPRLRHRRPSGKMPSAQGCEEGTGAAARAAAAAVARVL